MKYANEYDLHFMLSFRELCVKKADTDSVNKVAEWSLNPYHKIAWLQRKLHVSRSFINWNDQRLLFGRRRNRRLSFSIQKLCVMLFIGVSLFVFIFVESLWRIFTTKDYVPVPAVIFVLVFVEGIPFNLYTCKHIVGIIQYWKEYSLSFLFFEW
jgi:hypothetical protein